MARSVPGSTSVTNQDLEAAAPAPEAAPVPKSDDTSIVLDPRSTPASFAQQAHANASQMHGHAPDASAPTVSNDSFVVQKDAWVVLGGVKVLMPAGKSVSHGTYDVDGLRQMGVQLKSQKLIDAELAKAQKEQAEALAALKE